MENKNLGVYIHLPFCERKCYYCNFYSGRADKETIDAYCDKLVEAVLTYPFNHKTADTIYFGGGTPVLAGHKNIEKILNAIDKRFILKNPEITIEANPSQTNIKELSEYKKMGINRLSFGVQSLDEKQLKAIGRTHSAEKAIETLKTAINLGFSSVSADLMLGLPYETRARIEDFVKQMSKIGISHISSYMLKIEEGTALSKMKIKDLCSSEDDLADIYEYTVPLLESEGFKQYEISNFAQDGKVSKHNIKYWKLDDYIGIGPSAHSFINGKRYAFNIKTDEFISSENIYSKMSLVSDGGDFVDFLMLGLRLKEGVLISEIKNRSDDWEEILKRADFLNKQGLLEKTNEKIFLTTKGFLLSNTAISFLLWG